MNLPDQDDALNRVRGHFDRLAGDYDVWKKKNAYYNNALKTFLRRHVRPGSRVLEIGCATGEMLAAVAPAEGVGIDLSAEMIRAAGAKYPQYRFFNTAIETFDDERPFDAIIMVDVVHHVYDLYAVFARVHRLCHPQTKVIVTLINPWWEPALRLLEKLRWKMPDLPLNYLDRRNLSVILEPLNFKVAQQGTMLLLPKKIPLISYLLNTLAVRLWGLNKLAWVQTMILQPKPAGTTDLGYGCSVIIPCHNEEKNIREAVRRVPRIGRHTEIIVVDDGSTDGTADQVRALQPEFPNLRLIQYSPNRGKGHAVKQGLDAANQEVMLILDADLTTEPEELPRFFDPINQGMCRFTNGTRMVYPREARAMKFLNILGNKFFGLLMSFLTEQPLTDTLCGTKALLKADYQYIPFGKDKWGDYDLLFGAARLGLRILEIPVHYKSRKHGQSKMRSFQHGMHLLQAAGRGMRELIFVKPDGTE